MGLPTALGSENLHFPLVFQGFGGLETQKPSFSCGFSRFWWPGDPKTFIFLCFFKVLVAWRPKNLHFPLVFQGFGGLGTEKPSFSFSFSRFWWPDGRVEKKKKIKGFGDGPGE